MTTETVSFVPQMAKGLPAQTVAEAAVKCVVPVLEPKLDGWRILVWVDGDGSVRLFKPTRHKDKAPIEYTRQVPELVHALRDLPANTLLDGELVAQSFDAERGVWAMDFHRVQTAMASDVDGAKAVAQKAARQGLQLVVFDALAIDGVDLTALTLGERRDLYVMLLEAHAVPRAAAVAISQMDATQRVHDDMVGAGMEGSVIKDMAAPYAKGKRGHGWFKIKSTRTIDCVVMAVLMDGKGQHEGKAGRMVVGQMRPCPACGDYDSPCGDCDGGDVLAEVAKVNCLNNQQRLEATHDPDRFVGRVLEVKIYGWIEGHDPRHPTPMRFREDKLPEDCLWSQGEGA